MTTAHIYVCGFVQGVGFRDFVRKKAQELNLSGWVRNLPDNRVEALFQGSRSSVEKVITACRKGPFLSEVEDVVVDWEEAKDQYQDFQIRK